MGMTLRTFARFYTAHASTTPDHVVERIRLEKACRLIEAHRYSNKVVAVQ